jgi:hypothetical protein
MLRTGVVRRIESRGINRRVGRAIGVYGLAAPSVKKANKDQQELLSQGSAPKS